MKIFNNQSQQNDKIPHPKISVRVFIKHPIKGWKPFDITDSIEVYQNEELRLPGFANMVMNVVYARVRVEHGTVVALDSLTTSKWRFNAAGQLDQEAVLQQITQKLDDSDHPADMERSTAATTLNASDLKQVRQMLGLSADS